jgi:hypothetical protein
LARTSIDINDVDYSVDNSVPTPKWYKLFYKKEGPSCGEVLLSFALVDDSFVFKKTLS